MVTAPGRTLNIQCSQDICDPSCPYNTSDQFFSSKTLFRVNTSHRPHRKGFLPKTASPDLILGITGGFERTNRAVAEKHTSDLTASPSVLL